jgi:hypothetical protein
MSIWPFARKPKPLNPGPINEDWRAGDFAQCIDGSCWADGSSGMPTNGPATGDTMVVEEVLIGRAPAMEKAAFWLQFRGDKDHYEADAFKKVPPMNAACDAEFAAAIKAISPKHIPAKQA